METASDEAASLPARAPPAVVVIDVNEPPGMPALIAARGLEVQRQRLAPADYVVGPIAIERKTISDFHQSMVKKRLFEQLTRLRETYPGPVALLLEGDPADFAALQNPRASYGALLSATLDLDVRILPTGSRESSADMLATLARRVGGPGGERSEVRFRPRLLSPDAQQRFAVQGLPGIGDVVSEALLEHFGSLRRLFAATEKELQRVPGVGKTRAAAIRELLDRPYAGRQRRLPPG